MLGEIEARVGLFAITARPMSWWRRTFLDFLPYIQGQKVRFRMVVTALGDLTDETTLTYTVENNNGQGSLQGHIKQRPLRVGDKANWDSIEIPLYRTGDSLFMVWEMAHPSERQAAFMFHTTSRNTVFLTVVGIVVTSVVAVVTIA